MSASLASAIYYGRVTHHRVRPKPHALAYDIWSLLIDLDELDKLGRHLRWLSVGRFNLVSFHPRDREGKAAVSLKAQVESAMSKAGLEPDGGPIRLLTMPRVLGFAFNPLSIYFCHGRDGGVRAILWEVDNTFGERHGYLIPAESPLDGFIRQTCRKQLYVSPFMDMDLDYSFGVELPGQTFRPQIDVSDHAGRLLVARYSARREALSDAALLRRVAATPFLAAKVLGGIHWEALKIWLKGVGLRNRPPPPSAPISIIHRSREDASTP